MPADRMFQVIVLGGMGLVGAACGGTVIDTGNAAGGGGFPAEGPPVQQDASDSDAADAAADAIEEFPQEGPIFVDAGEDAADADDAGDADAGFPQEGPPP